MPAAEQVVPQKQLSCTRPMQSRLHQGLQAVSETKQDQPGRTAHQLLHDL